MKYCVIQLPLMLLFIIVFARNAGAIGYGLYYQNGQGSSSVSLEDDYGNTSDFTSNTSHSTFGLTLDTALEKNKLFNYRLSIGTGSSTDDSDMTGNRTWTTTEIDNTFGFGLVRDPKMRLWLGPNLHFSWSTYDGTYSYYGGSESYSYTAWKLGFGPALGFNYHITELLSPSVTLIYRGAFVSFISSHGDVYHPPTGHATENELLLNLSLYFKFGETF